MTEVIYRSGYRAWLKHVSVNHFKVKENLNLDNIINYALEWYTYPKVRKMVLD